MNADEFLSLIKSRNGTIYGPATPRDIELANTGLQIRRRAMLPHALRDLYGRTACVNLGAGYIFGPGNINRDKGYPIPSIVQVNEDMANVMTHLDGKTIFGRNDLFFFAFDAFGTFYMLDNLGLRPMKKYDDAWRAMSDCLMGGRF